MITDEDEEVVRFNLQLDEEYTFEDKDQHMTFCPPEVVVDPEGSYSDTNIKMQIVFASVEPIFTDKIKIWLS